MDADTQPTDIQATEVCFFRRKGLLPVTELFCFLK